MKKERVKRVGRDLNPTELQVGDRLEAPHKGIVYRIMKIRKGQILGQVRKGRSGRFTAKLVEIVPAAVLGYKIVKPTAVG